MWRLKTEWRKDGRKHRVHQTCIGIKDPPPEHGDANTRMITSDGKTGLSGGAGRGVMGGFANANGNVIGHTCGLSSSSDWKIVNGQPVINPTWLKSIKGRLTKETDTELVFGRLPVLASVVP